MHSSKPKSLPVPTDPEQPPRGVNHVLRWDEVPPPLPLTGQRAATKALIVAPIGVATTEQFREWIKAFVASRQSTPTNKAGHATIHVVADAADELAQKMIGFGHKPTPRPRGIFVPRTPREASLIDSAYREAKGRLEVFFRHMTEVPDDKKVHGADPISTVISDNPTGTFGRNTSVTLPGDEYARLTASRYDEFIFVCEEGRSARVIRRYGRHRQSWVILFPDLPPAATPAPASK